jgi:uncharacterized membrane protein
MGCARLIGVGLDGASVDEGDVPAARFLLAAGGLVLVGASGWLGGKLAYRYGVRVADEATQAEGYRQA